MHLKLISLATVVFAISLAASAQPPPSPVARLTPRLLRQLDRAPGEPVGVIVGVADGTPSPRALLMHPDPEGEPARRLQRIASQKQIAADMPAADFEPRHFYESFSLIAGRATPAAVRALSARPDVAWIALDGTKKPVQAGPQNAQILINSDQTNTKGFTGAGEAIAVIDTGVDYTVSSLGGAGMARRAQAAAGAEVW